jgi:hypothetical protein
MPVDGNRRKWMRRLRRPTAHRSLRLSASSYLPQPPHTPRRPPPVTRRRLRARWSSGRHSRRDALATLVGLVARLRTHAGVVLMKRPGGDQVEQTMALKGVVGQPVTAASPLPLSYYHQTGNGHSSCSSGRDNTTSPHSSTIATGIPNSCHNSTMSGLSSIAARTS